ncbi:MAG: lysophospholipid acyltransferase family protein [Desulfobacteraceae bacterium]|nr:lysophospholipid acyltransferase family protein [Desulfobacteraceae bacterium]
MDTLKPPHHNRGFRSYPVSMEQLCAYTKENTRHVNLEGPHIAWGIVRFIVWIANLLSWKTAYGIGRALGLLMFHLRIRRKVALTNLDIVYGDLKSADEKERIYKASLINFGRVMINYLRLPYQPPDFWRTNCTFKNESALRALLARNKGAIFVCGHIGMMDLAGGAVGMSGYPVAAVAKKMKNTAIDKFIVDSRTKMNFGTIPHKKSIRRILKGLKLGESILLVMDQNMKRRESIFIDWMGRPASVMPSAAFLVRKTGAPVLTGFLRQTGPDLFVSEISNEVEWTPIPEDPDREILVNTQKQADAVQQLIYENPELWFWIHRRWKVQPQGMQRPY